ncbi:PorT family protein [Rhodocytophaga rosea]|uniref:PorT family protein n=1 Tax=Rhodocytophaga rosea TaxID=2704465 RepID=A0A6C0GDH5_9BACT|nr:porin family protein [Rhodocytophaga rosea]QHT66011.1 PorT family protein [Rhodocytophaga rosea]
MKKSISSLVISLFFCFTSYAQISFITKAGVTFSDINFDKKQPEQQYKMGLVAGAGFNLPVIKDFFSIQPELLYIQKGYISELNLQAIDNDDPILISGKYQDRIHLNYLELPVLAKISFGGEIIRAYVNAGPSLGYCIKGVRKIEGEERKTESDIKFGHDQYFDNRFDFGAQFGGGIGLQAGPGVLLLDVRYGLGFSNLYKTGNTVSQEEAQSKHQVFALTMGYAIPLGKK